MISTTRYTRKRLPMTGVQTGLRIAALLTLTASSWSWAAPQPPDPDAALRRDLAGIVLSHHGHVALYARQLNTGRELAIEADTPVQTASVIKLTILLEAMRQIAAGQARWDEKITLKPGEPVGGSGLLTFLDTPVTLTLKDVLTLMIIVSDNTATNLAIDRFRVDAVNASTEAFGWKQTHLYKKIMKPATGPMPADQPKFGLGKTTPREMAAVIEAIGRCRLRPGPLTTPSPTLAEREVCAVGLKMLGNQFYRETIPRYLEKLDSSEAGTGIASKTGSLNAVRADVAIITAKSGPIILSVFTYDNADHSWTVDNEGELTIARLSRAIVQAWSPQGIDGGKLVPGLGLDPQATP